MRGSRNGGGFDRSTDAEDIRSRSTSFDQHHHFRSHVASPTSTPSRGGRRRLEGRSVPRAGAEEPAVTSDGSTIFALRAPDVVCCGDKSRGRKLRVVCLSDTHGKHHAMRHTIPDGDILIHCGDFSTKLQQRDFEAAVEDFDRFLGSLGHRHKLVIAGNHEIAFNHYTREQIQRRISNATYLEDSETTVEGLKFYGTPWTNSSHMGFSCRGAQLEGVWSAIPEGVDILLTHMPPFNRLDLAFDRGSHAKVDPCPVCGETHRSFAHWGSWSLTDRVAELKPKVHVFGHVHNSHGIIRKDDTVYINAAQDENQQPIFFDVWV
ncbi:unnamed protein product [Ectocarpus sp. 4 AP-2014]